MRRTLSMLTTLAVAAGLLTGCSASSDSPKASEGYDLTFWVYSDFVQGDAGALMKKSIAEFKTEHTNVKSITLVPKNDADLLSGLMSGVGLPDMFSASARDALKYRQAVGLLDLAPTFASDKEFASGFYPDATKAITTDDGVWAIPFISYIPVIYRNLTVLKKAGVDPADGIATYDTFLEQLAKVKASGVDATHSWTNNGYFAPGAVMASDAERLTVGVKDRKTTVKPEQLVRTFETVSAIEKFANKSMTNEADVTMEAFKTNKLGYLLGGPWIEPAIAQSGVSFDYVLVPPYKEGGWTGGLQGWDLLYGVKSDDDTRNKLVAAWLKKLGSYEGEKAWTLKVGRSTLRQDVMGDPEVVKSSEMAKISSKGLKNGMLQMDFGHSSVFWPSAIGDTATRLGTGAITPAEAADQFVKDINSRYAEAGE